MKYIENELSTGPAPGKKSAIYRLVIKKNRHKTCYKKRALKKFLVLNKVIDLLLDKMKVI